MAYLLRIDSNNYGAVYVRPADIRLIGKSGEGKVNIGVKLNETGLDLEVNGDVDEVAASLERAAFAEFQNVRLD